MQVSLAGRRVWVAGHRGMAGSALVRRLEREGCLLLTVPRSELDLREPVAVEAWMARHRPEVVFLAAATVGGIHANNSRPAEFLYDNLAIASAVIHGAWKTGVERLLFLGSTCIYPRLAPQPIPEEALLTGPLEPTNEGYAVAKIAGIKLCQAYRRQYGCHFIAVMPTNLYGPGDNYDLEQGHVFAALIARIHQAKVANADTVVLWGTGTPRREFLHVDDLADACVFLSQTYDDPLPVNIGSGQEITIRDLAQAIAGVIGYRGRFVQDPGKPDGTPRKLADISRLSALGWKARISLEDGIADAYRDFCARQSGPAA